MLLLQARQSIYRGISRWMLCLEFTSGVEEAMRQRMILNYAPLTFCDVELLGLLEM